MTRGVILCRDRLVVWLAEDSRFVDSGYGFGSDRGGPNHGSSVFSKRVMAQQYRVDGEHGNSFEVWKKMGSPQKPSEEQYAQLERAGQLDMAGSPEWRNPVEGKLPLKIKLPRQGVALVKLVW